MTSKAHRHAVARTQRLFGFDRGLGRHAKAEAEGETSTDAEAPETGETEDTAAVADFDDASPELSGESGEGSA